MRSNDTKLSCCFLFLGEWRGTSIRLTARLVHLMKRHPGPVGDTLNLLHVVGKPLLHVCQGGIVRLLSRFRLILFLEVPQTVAGIYEALDQRAERSTLETERNGELKHVLWNLWTFTNSEYA